MFGCWNKLLARQTTWCSVHWLPSALLSLVLGHLLSVFAPTSLLMSQLPFLLFRFCQPLNTPSLLPLQPNIFCDLTNKIPIIWAGTKLSLGLGWLLSPFITWMNFAVLLTISLSQLPRERLVTSCTWMLSCWERERQRERTSIHKCFMLPVFFEDERRENPVWIMLYNVWTC